MSGGAHAELGRAIRRLRDRAEALARATAPARAMTSPAIERATLRLFGVHGLDGYGRPLAAAVVERLAQLGPERLAAGVALPLARVALERGLDPLQAARGIASGDLQLVPAPADDGQTASDGPAAARERVARWTADAHERIDANRLARRELRDALGPGATPWLAALLDVDALDAAVIEARALLAAGADVLVVRSPAGREFTGALGRPVQDGLPRDMEPPPTGSQRGIAALRAPLDEMAAQRGAYVSLAVSGQALGAPELAAVAALERSDLVFSDPIDEIAVGVDPDRAFADHAAAHGLVARAGTVLVLGPGPLLVGRELGRGESPSALTRIGRGIAAQALAAAWARGSGLGDGQILIQAPFEAFATPDGAATVVAEVLARRLLAPTHDLAIVQPTDPPAGAWELATSLALLVGAESRLVLQRCPAAEFARRAEETRAAAVLASTMRRLLGDTPVAGRLPLSDDVFARAGALAQVALETLGILATEGWPPLVGEGGLLGARESATLPRGGAVPVTPDYAGPLVSAGS